MQRLLRLLRLLAAGRRLELRPSLFVLAHLLPLLAAHGMCRLELAAQVGYLRRGGGRQRRRPRRRLHLLQRC